MASKKLKKAIMAGLAGAAAAKMMGGKGTYQDDIMRGGAGVKQGKISMGQKAKNIAEKILKMGPGPNATSKKGGTLAGDYGDAFGDGYSGGAKAGKMIKARGGKLVNLKPTKLY
jgi:TfoX/Sxy family transcriptional regulator of competence genes